MSLKKCANCEEIIGNLESYYDFQGQYVCKRCKKRLDEQAQLVADNSVHVINETNKLPIEISKYNSSTLLVNNYQTSKGNYFKRHWRGELPLALSFWINLFLVNLLIQFIIAWYDDACPIANPVISARIAIIFNVLRFFVVYPWQIVGTWRSCVNHIDKYRKYFWSRTAQTLIVIGVITTFGVITSSWTVYEALYKIGFQKDEYDDYTLEMEKDNTIIHLKGGLGFGVSKDVKKLIEKYPSVNGIILDTIGGRIYEGRELYKLIYDYNLDTYSLEGCCSSGTIAYIAGNHRYLGLGANLAFHEYSNYEGLDEYIDLEKEQNDDLLLFRKQGVDDEFLDKMYTASSDDLWYPTIEEMIDAGVIHGIIKPSELISTDYGDTEISDIEKEMLKITFFKVLKKYEPESYSMLIQRLNDQLEQGASQAEIIQESAMSVVLIGENYFSQTSNQAAVNFINEFVKVFKELNEQDPFLCIKLLYPKEYGRVGRFPEGFYENMLGLLDSMANVLSDAYEETNPPVNIESAEEFLDKNIFPLLENDWIYLEIDDLQGTEDYKRHCDIIIKMYEAILSYDDDIAGNALRYFWTEE
ncbi:MAG: hypothetical protein JXI43_05515 [Tissierellales bacterium]|nr:hypothetical protein [Tissierellales bacterium]